MSPVKWTVACRICDESQTLYKWSGVCRTLARLLTRRLGNLASGVRSVIVLESRMRVFNFGKPATSWTDLTQDLLTSKYSKLVNLVSPRSDFTLVLRTFRDFNLVRPATSHREENAV